MSDSETTQPEHADSKIKGEGENLSPEITTKAKTIAKMADAATESGDEEALQVLRKSVENDPELMKAIKNRREDEGQESEEIDLNNVKRALEEFYTKFARIARLSARAMEARAVTESLFNDDDERSAVIAKVEALKSAIGNAISYDQAQVALNTFKSWYEGFKPTHDRRTRAKVNYFGGSLPDGLLAQVKMFDDLQGDMDNMKHYLDLTKE